MEMKYDNIASENRYLLLDSRNVPLAHVLLEAVSDGKILLVKVTDMQAEGVMEHEIYRLLSMDKDQPLIQCQFVQKKGEYLALEQLSLLDPELRKDLRVPLHSSSYLYFKKMGRSGRCQIQFVDISCGGMAFYGPEGLERQGALEVVLPIRTCPLIVPCQILHTRQLRNERAMYAAKFLDLCNDEEKMLREAVFSIQLGKRPCRSTN